ncbi:hypothetical protein [uncultured Chitinophaga sp.]|uniref:hypothetical protein n=1 Tax=uncultured Chitinophaga sp. TaxID=339340 RepID=UPI0025D77077|nr:hypothetical protein [uncultured Chitinophaga sp.]
MKYRIILVAIISSLAIKAKGQTAGQLEAGVRLGLPLGPTARYYISDKFAAEAIVGLYNRTVSLTALGEFHFDLSALTTEGFGWYAGGGAHLGNRVIDGNNKFLAGIDGIAGANYNFPTIPLNISIDWKPAVHFTTSHEFADFGISARYIFGRGKKD